MVCQSTLITKISDVQNALVCLLVSHLRQEALKLNQVLFHLTFFIVLFNDGIHMATMLSFTECTVKASYTHQAIH